MRLGPLNNLSYDSMRQVAPARDDTESIALRRCARPLRSRRSWMPAGPERSASCSFAGPPAKRQRRATTVFAANLWGCSSCHCGRKNPSTRGPKALPPSAESPMLCGRKRVPKLTPSSSTKSHSICRFASGCLASRANPRGTLCLERNTGNRGIPRSPPFSHAILVHELDTPF